MEKPARSCRLKNIYRINIGSVAVATAANSRRGVELTSTKGALSLSSMDDAAQARNRRALSSLMLASFGIGTGEFVIVGLVPGLAVDLHVSVPAAGLLISVYALSVAFGSPFVAALLSSVSRRRALVTLMVMFLVGDVACTVAPDFRVLMIARIVTALAHGAFFGIASIVASELAPPGKAVRAVALLFTGMTVANVVGVPLGTWIGQAAGWRITFALVATLAAAALAAMVTWMPRRLGGGAYGIRRELASLREPQIWLAMLISTLSSAALFSVLTFLTPLLEHEAGLTPHEAALALFLFGAGLSVGGLAGGRLADRNALLAIRALLVADAIALVSFGLLVRTGPLALVAVFVWGIAAFALVPPLQHRVVQEAKEAPNLASTLNQSAFNLGDALGAALGAAVLANFSGYMSLPWIAALVVCVALLPAFLIRSASR
jgi:MFS transporter, DHA1 family, inner membrane transport protein